MKSVIAFVVLGLVTLSVLVGWGLKTSVSADNTAANEKLDVNNETFLSVLKPGLHISFNEPRDGRRYRLYYAQPDEKKDIVRLIDTGGEAWVVTHVSDSYVDLVTPNGEWNLRIPAASIESIRVYHSEPTKRVKP